MKCIIYSYERSYSLSSAPQSKNAVCANIKDSSSIHLMSNFWSIHFHAQRLYVHMFDIVDILFSYERVLIICQFLQEFSKAKGSTLCVILIHILCFYFVGQSCSDLLIHPQGSLSPSMAIICFFNKYNIGKNKQTN